MNALDTLLNAVYNASQNGVHALQAMHLADLLTSFGLIFSAEMGDKSQLVCMSLAASYRAMPVLLGAISAFALLNTLAVLCGSMIALWLPPFVIAGAVALLFAAFGVQALLSQTPDGSAALAPKSNRHIFFSTLLLITVAEFGDKTQLAVVALGSSADPLEIWLGATLALSLTSALGIWAGRKVLQHLSLTVLHHVSGAFFLILAAFAAYKAYMSFLGG